MWGGSWESPTGRNGREEGRRAMSQAVVRAIVDSQARTGPRAES